MTNEGKGSEGVQRRASISDEAKAHLFGTIECDYDAKSGVFEVDAGSDQDAIRVFVGPNTDLSETESLIAEIEGRPVVYERAEDMPRLLVFPEGE